MAWLLLVRAQAGVALACVVAMPHPKWDERPAQPPALFSASACGSRALSPPRVNHVGHAIAAARALKGAACWAAVGGLEGGA